MSVGATASHRGCPFHPVTTAASIERSERLERLDLFQGPQATRSNVEAPSVPILGLLPVFKRSPIQFQLAVLERLASRGETTDGLTYLSGGALLDGIQSAFGGNRMAMVTDPKLAAQIMTGKEFHRLIAQPLRVADGALIALKGEPHTAARKVINPGLSPERVQNAAATMSAEVAAVGQRWAEKLAGTGEFGPSFELYREMRSLTFDVLVKSLFHVDLDEPTKTELFGAMDVALAHAYRRNFGPRWLQHLPTRANREFETAMRTIHGVADRILATAQTSGQNFLSTLVNARVADAKAASDPNAEKIDGVAVRSLDQKELRSEIVEMFIAGHETTAVGLTWALYQLAKNPEAQAVLQRELDAKFIDANLDNRQLDDLPFTKAVAKESMRLSPPVVLAARQAQEKTRLGDHDIEAGTGFVICSYVLHRHPSYGPDRAEFRPQRFLKPNERLELGLPTEETAKVPRTFEFGIGQYNCIGTHFALMEMYRSIATLVSRFDLELAEGTNGEMPFLDHAVVMKPAGPVNVRIRARS